MTKNIEEYKAKGEQDAIDNKEPESFDDSINNKFKEVYLSSYDTKKEEIEKQKKEDTENTAIGVVTIAAVAGGVAVYKNNKKKK